MLAKNAGFENFRDFQHERMHRYDYTPQDCFKFHDAVERFCVPVLKATTEARREALGLEALRPWDLAVDVHGREPLRPFDGAEQLIDRSSRVFHRMDGRLGEMFDELRAMSVRQLVSQLLSILIAFLGLLVATNKD